MSSFLRSVLHTMLLLILLTGASQSYADAKTATRILLFGDSIIAGYGLAAEASLSVQLQSYLQESYLQESYLQENYLQENYLEHSKDDVQVINGGVSGDTTSSGLTRLAWSLKRHSPDVVVLALGGNDVLRGLDPRITRQNLDAMLKILQEQQIPVILSQVEAPANLGEDYMKQLTEVYESLAAVYQVPLYPFLLKDIFTTPALMLRDGIHPSAAGVKAIAKPLGDYLIDFMAKQNSMAKQSSMTKQNPMTNQSPSQE